jgi:hypothetical protein
MRGRNKISSRLKVKQKNVIEHQKQRIKNAEITQQQEIEKQEILKKKMNASGKRKIIDEGHDNNLTSDALPIEKFNPLQRFISK